MALRNWILLVEDNEDELILLTRSIEAQQLQLDLVTARDGAEALDHLLNNVHNTSGPLERLPQLVLLDLNLPKVNGLEVLERIRSCDLTRLLPVVMLSTSDQEQDLRRSYEAGANSYVRKPVGYTDFQEAVKSIRRYWLGLNVRLPFGP